MIFPKTETRRGVVFRFHDVPRFSREPGRQIASPGLFSDGALGMAFGHLEAIEWMVGRALRQVDY